MQGHIIRIAALAAAFVVCIAAFAQARSDAAREKRYADEVIGSLVVGDAVWLQSPQSPRFLGLLAQAPQPKGAVVLTHGPGRHPDFGLTGELRTFLFDRGYTTLSLQMPVLASDDESGAGYRDLFDDAADRIAAGVRHLQAGGFKRIAVVSHAMGSGMTYTYLRRQPDAPLFAWAALSYYGEFENMPRVGFPIFDLFGENDYRGIRGPARSRKRVLDTLPGSKQLAVAGGGRFLDGAAATVKNEVAAFLDAAPR